MADKTKGSKLNLHMPVKLLIITVLIWTGLFTSILPRMSSNKFTGNIGDIYAASIISSETASKTAPKATPKTTPKTAPKATPKTTPKTAPKTASKTAPTPTPATRPILKKYTELVKKNKDVMGWIKIEGTKIDYPLVKHTDNAYYLWKDVYKKKSINGSIFVDYRNNKDLRSRNTLIYGHHKKDGSMFQNLVLFKNKDFFNSHRKIYLDNLYEEYVWEVFSVYVINASKESINIDYSKEGSFLKAINGYKNRSMYKTDTVLTKDDKIVSLVTCSYEAENCRTVVHAKYIGKRSITEKK